MSEVLNKEQSQPFREQELIKGMDMDYQQQLNNRSADLKQVNLPSNNIQTKPSYLDSEKLIKKTGFNENAKPQQLTTHSDSLPLKDTQITTHGLNDYDYPRRELGGIIRKDESQLSSKQYTDRLEQVGGPIIRPERVDHNVTLPMQSIEPLVSKMNRVDVAEPFYREDISHINAQYIDQPLGDRPVYDDITISHDNLRGVTRTIEAYREHNYDYINPLRRTISVPVGGEDFKIQNDIVRNEVMGSQSFSLTPQNTQFAKSIYVPQYNQNFNQNILTNQTQTRNLGESKPKLLSEQQQILNQDKGFIKQIDDNLYLKQQSVPDYTRNGPTLIDRQQTPTTGLNYLRTDQNLIDRQSLPYYNRNIKANIPSDQIYLNGVNQGYATKPQIIPYDQQDFRRVDTYDQNYYRTSQPTQEYIRQQTLPLNRSTNQVVDNLPLDRQYNEPEKILTDRGGYSRTQTLQNGYDYTRRTIPNIRIDDYQNNDERLIYNKSLSYTPQNRYESTLVAPRNTYQEQIITITRPIKPIPLNNFDRSILSLEKPIPTSPMSNERLGQQPSFHYGTEGCRICGGYGFIKNKKSIDKMEPCLICVRDTGYCHRCRNTGYVNNDIKNKCPCKKIR